ncbi:hypothetical protein QBC47DRAFT_420638 [Echria macrotheca]|uniref:Uncharacterized protein n=1 Tax=Echria macrotheca TaxID=438768 RepID=A0AAJ0FFD5_9PEZI|nr:hypothetical protein QBC47DRAFT_420638 [Echria macrotheca]
MLDTAILRRSALLGLASLSILGSASAVNRPECIHTRSLELARLASCGDVGSLNHCFSKLVSQQSTTPVEQLTSELETCFQNAGCTLAESQIEALWTLQRCETEPSELRRRRGSDGVAAMPVLRAASPGGGITILAARQGDAASTPPAAAEPPTPTTAPANTNSPSPCFTETSQTITSCPTQSTGADAGKHLSCFETTVPSQVCAAGLICQVDNQGSPSCMFKHSGLDLAGIIIAIFFASAIAISVISICFFCCKERRVQRRLIRAAEAAKIAQEAKTAAMVSAKKAGPSASSGDNLDRQPLMSQASDLPPLPQQYQGGYQAAPGTEYGGAHGSNPFADSHDSHPLR